MEGIVLILDEVIVHIMFILIEGIGQTKGNMVAIHIIFFKQHIIPFCLLCIFSLCDHLYKKMICTV